MALPPHRGLRHMANLPAPSLHAFSIMHSDPRGFSPRRSGLLAQRRPETSATLEFWWTALGCSRLNYDDFIHFHTRLTKVLYEYWDAHDAMVLAHGAWQGISTRIQ